VTLIPIPHDALFKQFLTDPTVAKDFLDIYLPQKIKDLCQFNTLKLQPSSYVEKNLKQFFSDIVYSLKIADTDAYIYTLIEHLTTPKKLTAFTLLRYQVAIMKQHVDQGYDTLPIVVPLLFYRGATSPYPFTNNIFDCFSDKKLAQEIFLNAYPLIDITVIPDEELRTHKSIALLELIQKNIHQRDALEFVQDIAGQLAQNILTDELFNSLLYYISQEGESKHFEHFYSRLADALPHYRENIMTLSQQLQQKGLEQGLQQGEYRKALAIAKNMSAKRLNPLLIKEITGLSDEDLHALED
jgi:predicted transposase/invertase (TIGR01784 family)